MTTVEMSAAAVGVVCAAAATGAAAQAITGFGFSLVVAPVLVQVVGPVHAVRLVNVLAVGINTALLVRERRSADLRLALGLLVPAVVVAPLVAFAVHRVDTRTLSVVVGVLIILCSLALASGRRVAALRGRRGLVAAGVVAAAMNTASGVAGPAVAMYSVNAEWPVRMARPTMQVYFLGLNVLSFLALGPVFPTAHASVGIVAAAAAGFAAGSTAAGRVSPAAVGRAVLILAFIGGVAAIGRGV